ncbi:MAG TPA: efflux RND transporter periplasmic adaptor subunit [Thermoanaerobaculia bacterium]|nr:efflux RND transporter periplasmic adaptor subunit [Thermoanaerobaculia bacterium]
MNRRKTPLVLATILAVLAAPAILLTAGCGKAKPTAAAEEKTFICPMHPEIVKDHEGDCPICGMRLVLKEQAAVAPAAAHETWVCPMHPEIVKEHKESCPICGMDLVKKEEGAEAGDAGVPGFATVTIDARKRQLLSLKTAKVERGTFGTGIRTVGRVAYDERRIHHVHTRFEAYVEHVAADFTGKFVRKGEVLAHVYSPELFATQQELLLALRAVRALGPSADATAREGAERLLDATRQRLSLWDVTEKDIAALEARGEPLRSFPIYAPTSGYVTARTAFHGMKVMPADTLFDIVDLSAVWVLADVYESELPRVKVGQTGRMTLAYRPGQNWTGKVTYIYPSLDEKTRTAKVRLEFANPREELKPEMFADVVLESAPRTALKVPDDAVLDSGTRKVVFVAKGEGVLEPREVTLGEQGGGAWEVLSGLSEGEEIALGASFLVDSESRLASALAGMRPAGPEPGREGTARPSPSPALAAPDAGHKH